MVTDNTVTIHCYLANIVRMGTGTSSIDTLVIFGAGDGLSGTCLELSLGVLFSDLSVIFVILLSIDFRTSSCSFRMALVASMSLTSREEVTLDSALID